MSRSSSNALSPRRRRAFSRFRGFRGFTLIEVLVSITILTIIIVLSGGLLFAAKAQVDRQRVNVEPRQAVRRVTDYMYYAVRGAGDLNYQANNPNAIVAWYLTAAMGTGTCPGTSATCTQASFDNLLSTGPQALMGDPGTDIITLAVPPPRPLSMLVAGFSYGNPTTGLKVTYTDGCPTQTTQLANFKADIGWDPVASLSQTLTIILGGSGGWDYFQVTAINSTVNDCTNQYITISGKAGNSNYLNSVGGQPIMLAPISIQAGVSYTSFRVRTINAVPTLEQKFGLFNPAVDNPGTVCTSVVTTNCWVPLMPNVEDLQVAYIYNNGVVVNDPNAPPAPFLASNMWTQTAGTARVPPQAGTGAPSAADIRNVVGLRISLTTRSSTTMPITVSNRTYSTTAGAPTSFFRPASENHAVATVPDGFVHVRMTTTALIRNRILGF